MDTATKSGLSLLIAALCVLMSVPASAGSTTTSYDMNDEVRFIFDVDCADCATRVDLNDDVFGDDVVFRAVGEHGKKVCVDECTVDPSYNANVGDHIVHVCLGVGLDGIYRPGLRTATSGTITVTNTHSPTFEWTAYDCGFEPLNEILG